MWSTFLLSFFLLSLFAHCVLYKHSPVPSICCSFSPFFSHSSRTVFFDLPSQFRSHFLFPPLSRYLVSLPVFLSIWTTHINLLLTNFFLKLFFIPTSTISSPIHLLSALLVPTLLLIRLFSQTRTFCRFCVSAIIPSTFIYALS